jgi:hypothetical protein
LGWAGLVALGWSWAARWAALLGLMLGSTAGLLRPGKPLFSLIFFSLFSVAYLFSNSNFVIFLQASQLG